MDTGKQYVRMCEKAGEIQKSREVTLGDFYAKRNEFGYHVIGSDSLPELTRGIFYGQCIWLPRQDQLQDMVKSESGFDNSRMVGLELCDLFSWYQRNRPRDIGDEMRRWPSWEQLWLAFVMKEKYSKVWNLERWE